MRPEREGVADIGIRDGRIAAIGDLARAESRERFVATGLHALPGVVDSHVHFREPGDTHKETFESGSQAALRGGVTTVFDMPNTRPPVVSDEEIEQKFALARGNMACDYAFYLGATCDNHTWLAVRGNDPGIAGIKIYMGSSTGDLLVAKDEDIAGVLRAGTSPVAVHAEDEDRLTQRRIFARRSEPATHPEWRDAEAARLAVARLARLARAANRRVHVLHVSSADELPLFATNRNWLSAEVTPHHLTLTAEVDYPRLGTRAQVNPPVRERRHVEALWDALRAGVFETIGSDHSPHGIAEKSEIYPETPSGMPGVATLLPVMLQHVTDGQIELGALVRLLAEGPARRFGLLRKGRIDVGLDADLALVDLSAKRTIADGTWASRSGWTPYVGRQVTGWPVATVLRGRIVMRNGEITVGGSGLPVSFDPNRNP